MSVNTDWPAAALQERIAVDKSSSETEDLELEAIKMDKNTFRIGDVVVTRIDEKRWIVPDPAAFYPDLDLGTLSDDDTVPPGSYEPGSGWLTQSTHSWLLRTPVRTVLIDTATGNGKPLPMVPALDHLEEPYLERLAAAGVSPGDVDVVLLTHLHVDHVGWNTREENGRWTPTFANARYVFSSIEERHGADLSGGGPAPHAYDQSVRPVVEAGLAELIAIDGHEVLEGLSFHPTPGHSVDHASIRLRSRGEEAWILGDVAHHQLQVHRPNLSTAYCEDPDRARASRLWMLEQAAESGATCFSSHFTESSAGRVTRRGDRFAWSFL